MTCPRCGKALKRTLVKDYPYRESGLGNVYLQNIATYQCECGEKLVQIPVIDRLHDTIAYYLLKKPSLLTGEEFRFLRKWVGLTANQLLPLLLGENKNFHLPLGKRKSADYRLHGSCDAIACDAPQRGSAPSTDVYRNRGPRAEFREFSFHSACAFASDVRWRVSGARVRQ